MFAINSKKLKKMIEIKIHHPYIEKYIDQPEIDLDKLGLLLYIFDEVDMLTQRKYEYIISVMLVQVALDTHDRVTNESRTPLDDKKRQLNVLAGDFYSGLCYQSLSKLGEIPLIRSLANAIKEVTEEKMLLYRLEAKSWRHLMQLIESVESVLFTTVAKHYQLSDEEIELIRLTLFVNRLMKELDTIENGLPSRIDPYIEQNIIEPPHPSLVYSLEMEIERHKAKIHHLLKDNVAFHPLVHFIFGKKMLSAVEEG